MELRGRCYLGISRHDRIVNGYFGIVIWKRTSLHVHSKALTLALVLCLIAGTGSVSASQTPTPGKKCQKIGQTSVSENKLYICVKKGKRLVWNKGVENKKDKIYQPPRYKESLTIQSLLDQSASKSIDKKSEVTWFFQTDDATEIKWTKNGVDSAILLYSQLGFDARDSIILVPKDQQWFQEQMEKIECRSDNFLDSNGWLATASCPNGRTPIIIKSFATLKGVGDIRNLNFQHIGAHEYFHKIQYDMTSSINRGAPFWLIEGGANFFSSLAYWSWNRDKNYEQHFEFMLKNMDQDYFNSCISKDLASVTNGPWEQRKCAYSKGAKAVEYIVANYGINGYKALYSTGDFQSSLGISETQFYKELETFFTNQGWSKSPLENSDSDSKPSGRCDLIGEIKIWENLKYRCIAYGDSSIWDRGEKLS